MTPDIKIIMGERKELKIKVSSLLGGTLIQTNAWVKFSLQIQKIDDWFKSVPNKHENHCSTNNLMFKLIYGQKPIGNKSLKRRI